MRSILHLFFTLICVLHVAVAIPQFSNPHAQLAERGPTNAARLQAGLPLLKPRKFFNPTRVSARDPNPSVIPPTTGGIEVRDANGNRLGFVSKSSNPSGLYGYTTSTNPSDYMGVSVPSGGPSDMTITTGSAYPYFGFILTNGNVNLANGYFGRGGSVQHTDAGSSAKKLPNSFGPNAYTESSIWTLSNGQLIPSWIESTGSPIPVTIFYQTSGGIFTLAPTGSSLTYPRVTFWIV